MDSTSRTHSSHLRGQSHSTIGFIVLIIGFVLLAFGQFGHAVGGTQILVLNDQHAQAMQIRFISHSHAQ